MNPVVREEMENAAAYLILALLAPAVGVLMALLWLKLSADAVWEAGRASIWGG